MGNVRPTTLLARGGTLAAVAAAAVLVHAAAASAAPRVYAVSPQGSDAGPGTAAQPWRTIGHAARLATPGSTVDVRGGTYHELVHVRVSGRRGAPITFRAHPGEHVTLSGEGLPRLAAGHQALISVAGRSYLRFRGFELRDLVDLTDRSVPVGVWVTGAAHHIDLERLDVHGIRTKGGDAHGIAVYGTSGRHPIHDLVIAHDRVHDNHLGSSESVVVNGNVSGWRITHNHVFRNDNIGIDAIGYERTAPRHDRARHGLIAHNHVEDIDSLGNPAYDESDGSNCRCADGIYIDGGRSIVIRDNVVLRSNIGLEIASEHARGSAADVLAEHNRIAHSTTIGLAMGGYDRHRGRTVRAHVRHNTFVDDDTLHTGSGELLLQFRVQDSDVVGNTFVADRQGILIANPYKENTGNTVDGNTWWAEGVPRSRASFQWKNVTYHGFRAYRRATGNDRHGRYADPHLDRDGRPR